MGMSRLHMSIVAALCITLAIPSAVYANESRVVTELSIDIMGNKQKLVDIVDPKVQGVACYMTTYERSLTNRVVSAFQKDGIPFIDPSNASLVCMQTESEIHIGDIDKSKQGENILTENRSLIFKKFQVRRVYDPIRNTLLYVGFSTDIVKGSPKSTLGVIKLNGADVTWDHKD